MKNKKFISSLLCASLLFSTLLSTSVSSESNIVQTPLKENSWRYHDGERIDNTSLKSNSIQLFSTPWSKVNGQFVNDSGTVIEGATQKGIDVSKWQGTIDWQKVKETDVDYAIIRCGYGDNYTNYDDPNWFTNANACTDLGIPFGVYLYSYATSISEAQSEAAHVLRLVKDYHLTFPIYLDLEDNSLSSLSSSELGAIAQTFCDIIQAAGYEVGIYANKYWWTSKLTDPAFNNSSWYKWVAQYNSTCTYEGTYTMWQCTSSGSVNGISGNVDLNFWFGEPRILQDDDESYRMGDINFDHLINTTDAMLLLSYDAGLTTLTEAQLQNADVSTDGKIDAADAMLILRLNAGIINSLGGN